MCEILNKISHRRKATSKNIFDAFALLEVKLIVVEKMPILKK